MEQQQLGEVIPSQFFPPYGLACRRPVRWMQSEVKEQDTPSAHMGVGEWYWEPQANRFKIEIKTVLLVLSDDLKGYNTIFLNTSG